MEICPQGISIFILYSLLKSKSTKRTQGQSLRPKRRIQNLVKRLRWSFLRKYLRTFSYKLLSLLSKLLYTEAYPEPSGTSKMDFLATTLNGFQLLLSLLPKLFYSDAHSEPSQTLITWTKDIIEGSLDISRYYWLLISITFFFVATFLWKSS